MNPSYITLEKDKVDYVRNELLKLIDKEALEVLLCNGVIAGGTMVKCCDGLFSEKRDIETIDIDVYVNDLDNFKTLVVYFKPIATDIFKLSKRSRCYNSTPDIECDDSILNIKYKKQIIQLIYFDYETPKDILDSYDMDYVQCAFSGSDIIMSEWCKTAYHNKQVRYISKVEDYRIRKALYKGFYVPIWVYACMDTMYSDEAKEIVYPTTKIPPVKRTWFDLFQLEIVNMLESCCININTIDTSVNKIMLDFKSIHDIKSIDGTKEITIKNDYILVTLDELTRIIDKFRIREPINKKYKHSWMSRKGIYAIQIRNIINPDTCSIDLDIYNRIKEDESNYITQKLNDTIFINIKNSYIDVLGDMYETVKYQFSKKPKSARF